MFKLIFYLIVGVLLIFPSTMNAEEKLIASSKKILNDLYEAHGDKRYPIPTIKLVETNESGATYRRRTNVITIEKKALQVCRSMGKDSLNALAFLIGHELAHAFQKIHGSSFLSAHRHRGTDYLEEQDADIFGVFVSYLAGYKNYKILPQIIESMYNAYNLKDQILPDYPPFKERKATCDKVLAITEELVHLFEAANCLAVLGQYELARECYEYIEKHYKGAEIKNNIGVNYAMQALNFTEANTEKYIHPFEIDINTRLQKQVIDLSGKGLTPEQRKQKEILLDKAEKHFIKASKRDVNYLIAELNLMCVMNIKGEYEEVVDYYRKNLVKTKAINQPTVDPQLKAKIQICLALALAETGKKEDAIRVLGRIEEEFRGRSTGILASQNSNIILNNRGNLTSQNSACEIPVGMMELVDNIRLHRPVIEEESILALSKATGLTIRKTQHSLVYYFVDSGTLKYSIQRVNKPMKMGGNWSKDKFNEGLGYYSVCRDERVLIKYNETEKIADEWVKYFDPG